ncbi:alpha/beta-hydrolase [Vararia minispora EC-137]|uniref:Alpha/beta-hydrolase n=1 Tax=Vararia minispora EC-137 TaxID=1314806 RepID=A0ACB8QQW2_9AGAM|nr:alpha/beta-hydrolase [Vararia minispora EC-137]
MVSSGWKRLSLAVLTVIARQSLSYAQSTVPVKVADLGYATYQTDLSLDEGVTSFLGIRYAAAPVGDLRFRAPEPPESTSGIQNAITQPDECFQGNVGLNSVSPFRKRTVNAQNEDCLFINVHVPTDSDANSNLPVVAWIHGGGYTAGSIGGSVPAPFPAQTFVHSSNGSLVSVQIQYRLGAFGFLPGKAVADDGALNAGLLDQQYALQWIQTHISKFGGDPTRVSIYGESAGAGSVLQHIVANGGNTQPRLFQSAMMSSPFLPFQYAYDDPVSEELYAELLNRTNCTDRALACLRTVDATTLSQIGNAIEAANFFGVFTWVPVVDGKFSVERPTVLLAERKINTDVALVFTNAHEGNIFVNSAELVANNTTLTEYITQLLVRLNDTSIQQAVSLYSNIPGLTSIPQQAAQVMGEVIFVCPAYFVLNAFDGHSSWKGEFAVPPATHGLDVLYVFADASVPAPPVNNSEFIGAFQQAFFDVALSLDPNVHTSPIVTPEWPSYNADQEVMVFNVTEAHESDIAVVGPDTAQLERCAFWQSLAAVNAQ